MSDQEITFTGEYPLSLDSQRRVSVPKQWRGEGLKYYILPGRNGILQFITQSYFMDFLKQVRKVSLTNAKIGRALAMLGSSAQEVSCDKQGRISISAKLKKYASLDSEVVMVGAFTHAQIWTKESWDAQNDDPEAVLDVIDGLFGNSDGDFMDLLNNLGAK